MAFLAIGDPIRIGAGIPIPNPRMTRVTGYNAATAAAVGVLPDGWTIQPGGAGGITPNLVAGWSSRFGIRVLSSPPTGGNNFLFSPKTRGGILPNFAFAARQLRIRLLAIYAKDGSALQTVTPMMVFWNRDESSAFFVAFPAVTPSATYTLYDDSAIADMSTFTLAGLGWADPYIDHANLFFTIGGDVAAATFSLAEVAAMWSLTDPGGATGYDQMVTRAEIGSVEFYEQDLGRFERHRTGHHVWEDMTGGQQPRRMSAEFAALTDADVKLLTLARNLNRGTFVPPASANVPGDNLIPVAPCPIVAEIPYWQQDLSQGPRPYFMYANIVDAPRWKWPNGYLLGRHGASLVFEEPEG